MSVPRVRPIVGKKGFKYAGQYEILDFIDRQWNG